MDATVWILNLVVLVVVLHSDIGTRGVTRFRVLRPILSAALIVPFFLGDLAVAGDGLLLEIAGVLAGVLLGLVASAFMPVHAGTAKGRPRAVSRAGWGYASAWVAVVVARILFAYGSEHIFGRQLGEWMAGHSITSGAFTDALIFLAVLMMVTRTVVLHVRARAVLASSAPAVATMS